MYFEFFEELQDIPKEPFENMEPADFLEEINSKASEEEEELPPYLGRIGESVEHRVKRHELESDIKNGYETAAKNSYKELIEIEKREAAK